MLALHSYLFKNKVQGKTEQKAQCSIKKYIHLLYLTIKNLTETS